MNTEILSYKNASANMTDLTYTDWFYRLMLIARTRFKWNNLPNNMDERWIERWLFTEGKCVFFKDEEYGFMIAKMTPNGQINFYDDPTMVRPYGTNYTGKDLMNDKECVIIRNNDIMLPTAPTIQLFAMRLTEITRTIDVNIEAQKTPVLIKCSDKQRVSLKQVYQQWKGNEPVIFGDKTMDTESFEVLNTEAPVVFDKLQIQKHQILNECYTFLGINNANMDKRERLVDDEVQANNQQVDISAHVMLKARERACEMINKIFGLNISVELREAEELKLEELELSNEDGDING